MFVAPPGYQPVYSPRIPYLGPIYGGLRDGSAVYLQGAVPENITRFFINLLCGEAESSDVAMHFNPRFDGWDKVVFNSRVGGSWQDEDKIRRMPFSKGSAFEMVVMVTSKGYQIKVNGKDFYTFPHRLPVDKVRGLEIGGDVSIQTINVMGGGSPGGGSAGGYPGGQGGYPGGQGGDPGGQGGYPGGGGDCLGGFPGGQGGYPGGQGGYPGGQGGYPGGQGGYPGDCSGGFPGGQGGYPGGQGGYPGDCSGGLPGGQGGYPGSTLPGMGGQPVYNPAVPYSCKIPGGMFPKRTVIIRGMVPFDAKSLRINFKVSRSNDVALHMNPRMKEGVVVRNSMIGGSWGKEERELSTNPFTQGQYFDMSVRCGNRRFKVYVNGQHLFDYVHRLQDFNEVDMLDIQGDVQISYIHF